MKKTILLAISLIAFVAGVFAQNADSTCTAKIEVVKSDPASGTYWTLYAGGNGVQPAKYLWNTGSKEQKILVQQPGEYCVTITYANCTAKTCVLVKADSSCAVVIEKTSTGALAASTKGVAPFMYKWTGPNGFTSTERSIIPKVSGQYCVTVKDAAGCVSTACINIVIPPPVDSTCRVEIKVTQLPVPGTTLFYWVLSAIPKGQAPFKYNWSTGSLDSTITVRQAGKYCVRLVTATGCVAEACVELVAPPPQDTTCKVEIKVTPVPNAVGWVLSAIPKGKAPFKYAWSTGSEDSTITVRQPGKYCVKLTTATGCITDACVEIAAPPPVDSTCKVEIKITPIPNPSATTNQWILTAITRGAAPFTFKWSNGSTDSSIIVNAPGKYCVRVVSKTGCVAEACVEVIAPPPPGADCAVKIEVTKTNFGWRLNAIASPVGPNSPAIYFLWNNGQTGPVINVSAPGKYCVVIITQSGCTANACVEIKPDNPICSARIEVKEVGVSVWRLTAIGSGVGPFKYQWSNGSKDATIYVAFGGRYCVTITDSRGCTAEACTQVGPISTVCSVTIVKEASGALVAQAKGMAPFKYEWNGPNGFTANTQVINPVGPGVYCVVVKDATGCIAKACFTVEAPPTCQATIKLVPPSSNTQKPKLCVSVSGTGPFKYLWSNGKTTECIEIDTLSTTVRYCVTVTNADGSCKTTACYPSGPNPPTCSVTVVIDSVNAGPTTVLWARPTGKAPFKYLWSNGATTERIKVTESGEYCVTITDSENCIAKTCFRYAKLVDPVDAKPSKKGVSFYPNPAQDALFVLFSNPQTTNATVRVYTMTGALVVSDQYSSENGSSMAIDLGNFQPGLYLVSVTMNGETVTEKIVKQ